MAHGSEADFNFVERFEFGGTAKRFVFALILVGLVLAAIGLFTASNAEYGGHHGHHGDDHAQAAQTESLVHAAAQDEGHQAASHQSDHSADAEEGYYKGHTPGGEMHHPAPKGGFVGRLYANLLTNSFLFMGTGLLCLFFVAVSAVSNAGWYVLFKRIPEALGAFIPIGGLLLIVIFLLGNDYLYAWAIPEVVENDPLIQKKTAFLNEPLILTSSLVIVAIWTFFLITFWKISLAIDNATDLRPFNRFFTVSITYLVVFALTISVASWGLLMSIDPHWFSTMYAVRVFSSLFVMALGLVTLVLIWLRREGFMKQFNASHQHDLGKFIFGFSIFWAYIWFSEYLLIWYANIPEEGAYFHIRLTEYPSLFFGMFVLNFLVPFLVLMTNSSKRQDGLLAGVIVLLLFGHFIDFYLLVFPGVLGDHVHFGLLEIGAFILFLGLFLFVGLSKLAKMPLVSKNHPYLKESVLHHYDIG